MVAGIVLVAVIAASAASLLSTFRSRDLVEKRQVLENLALVLAEQIDRSFQTIDMVQSAEIAQFQAMGVASADDLARLGGSYEVYQRLNSRITALPFVDAFVLTDTEGRLLNISRAWPAPKVKVPDQDPHRQFQADPGLLQVVAMPILSPFTGRWDLLLARKITGAKGEFIGALIGVVETQYFEQLFQAVAISRNASIALGDVTLDNPITKP